MNTAFSDGGFSFLRTSGAYFKGFRREFIDEDARRGAVNHAKGYCRKTEDFCGHFHLHHKIANEVSRGHYELVSAAFNLRSGVIRLEEVVNRKIMHRKEHAHTDYRNDYHGVVRRVVGSSCGVKERSEPAADYCRRR